MNAVARELEVMQALRLDHFWTQSLDLRLMCFSHDKPVDREQLRSLIRRRPPDVGGDEALRSISPHPLQGGCTALGRDEYENLVITAACAFDGADPLRTPTSCAAMP